MSHRSRVIEDSDSEESSDSSGKDDDYFPEASKSSRKSTPSQQSQQTTSTSQKQTGSSQNIDISEDELMKCAGLVGNYLLAAEPRKVAVKRAELSKMLGKQHMRHMPGIISRAGVLLEKIYGYKLQECEQKKHTFILLNKLAPPINSLTAADLSINAASSEDEDDEEVGEGLRKEGGVLDPCSWSDGDEKQGLLMVVLMLVFMMGGEAEEGGVQGALKTLGVHVDSKDPHPLFGNTKKLLEEFAKQGYLEFVVQKDMEPATRLVSWGERAHLQVCKKAVLQLVCKIYGGGMKPQDWPDHWAKAINKQASPDTSSGNGFSSSSSVVMMEVDEVEGTQGRDGNRKKSKVRR